MRREAFFDMIEPIRKVFAFQRPDSLNELRTIVMRKQIHFPVGRLSALLKLLIVLVSLTVSTAQATPTLFPTKFSSCRAHFAGGEPPRVDLLRIPGRLRELCFEAFAVLHSGQSKTPVWVAQRLDPEGLAKALQVARSGRFYQEARLPSSERATLEDYHGSGWDRGHMAPAGDMPSENAMAQSFSLANMVPQAPDLNRGVWADYEKSTRRYVRRVGHAVYVITGPVYRQFQEPSISKPLQGMDLPMPRRLGPSSLWVPDAIFKLVYDPTQQRAWAYWAENRNDTKAAAPISLQALRQRLGHQWLPYIANEDQLRGVDAMTDDCQAASSTSPACSRNGWN